MNATQQPRFILIGVTALEDPALVVWRIQTPDGKVCGMDMGDQTDDGILVSRPQVREWAHAEQASVYMARLEDGSAGTTPDLPVVWIELAPYLTPPPPIYSDGPL